VTGDDATPREQARILRLRRSFLALVLLLLAAVGISVVASLTGIARMDATLSQAVARATPRVLHVTHIRRLFRSELVLAHERQSLGPGPERDELDRRSARLRAERGERIEQLKALGVPGGDADLAVIESLHQQVAGTPSDDSQAWEKPIAALLERAERRFAELRRQAAVQASAARWLLVVASLGALLAALGLGGLVLYRVRGAGRELARSEEQFRRVVESAPSLLVMLSPARKPTFLSARAPAFLGRPRVALDEDFFAWVAPAARAEIERRCDECLRTGVAVHGLDAHAVRADGSEWDAWLSLTVAPSDGGRELLVQILDITAQRKAEAESRNLEAQLRQAQKMESIGILAGGVAHDFNNLLTAIKGHASLLVDSAGLDVVAREDLRAILGATDRAAALTRQLLSFCRKQAIELRPHRLDVVVAGMEQLLRRVLGEDVRLEVRTGPGRHVCMVDTGQVEQIIMNLAVNARQAMEKGGLLVIETSDTELGEDHAQHHPEVKPGPYVELTVSDTGVGMTPEVQRRAFDPFFTTKPVGQGTGLGLAVVYGAVRQQGGHVHLYSEPNVGTTFRIYWPACAREVAAEAAAPPEASARGTGAAVLLVEDDGLVRSFARRALEDGGYRVTDAEDAERALELASTMAPPPAILVTDVVLPGRHGPALARLLRERFPELPVLLCSGYSEQMMTDTETGSLHAGDPLLQKPYDARTLVERVRQLLDGKALPAGQL